MNIRDAPNNKKVTRATMACDYILLKDKKFRVRIDADGDRLLYHQDAGSPETDLIEEKLILNSVISDSNKVARFMSLGWLRL